MNMHVKVIQVPAPNTVGQLSEARRNAFLKIAALAETLADSEFVPGKEMSPSLSSTLEMIALTEALVGMAPSSEIRKGIYKFIGQHLLEEFTVLLTGDS